MKPQFFGVRETASNIGTTAGLYTVDMFANDFPQFFYTSQTVRHCVAPDSILEMFISLANGAIQTDKWLDLWRYACGLYVAHNLTMYLQTYSASSSTPAQAAASGALVGVISSATLGDSSVSYDTAALTKATENWGDLNATRYGQELATKARMVGMGGTYVI